MPIVQNEELMEEELPGGDESALSEEEKQWVSFADDFDAPDSPNEGIEIGDEEVEEEEVKEVPPEPAAEEPEEKPQEIPEAAEVKEEPKQPIPPPVEEAAQQPQAPQPPPVEQPQPQPAAQQPQQQAPTAEQWQKMRSDAEKQLVQALQLSQEDRTALEEDPNAIAEILPQMGARLFLDAQDAIMNQIYSVIPNLVQNVVRYERTRTEGEEAFFQAWPELREHAGYVQQVGAYYLQQKPNATREDFIKAVGPQAWVGLQLPIEKLMERTGQAQAAQTPPAAPQQVQRQPANPGRATPPPPPPPTNPYEQLANQFLAEEDLEYR